MTNIRKKGFAFLALVMVLTLLLTCVLAACNDPDKQEDVVYSLTFDPNYDGAEPTTVNLKANEAEAYPAPSRDGYNFIGWTFDKLGKVPFDKYRLETGMTIYAQWSKIAVATYTVRFLDHEGKNVISTQQVEAGNAAIEPDESEYSSYIPSGYLFDGWDKSFSNITANTDVTMIIAKNQDIPPVVVTTYTVRFLDSTGTELIAKRTVEEGKAATAPNESMLVDYIPTGYVFKGWDKAFDNVTSNIDVLMIIEKVINNVTVTFKNGDDVITSFEGEVGNGIPQKVDAPSKDGFNFYRFETEDGKVFDENSKFSVNETYFATWTIATPTSPSIVLDKESYVYGDTITLSLSNKVEHEGITYTYEWLDGDDNTLASGLTYQATDKAVGTYSFKIKVTASLEGYKSASATSSITYATVDKANLIATVQSKNVVYGDAAPSQYDILLSGFVYDENESVVDKSSLAFDCTYTAGLGIGNYNVSASGLSSDNYNITYSNGTLTVTQKDLVIEKQDSAVYAKVAIEKRYDSLTNTALLDGHVLSLVVKTNSANVGVYKNTDSINNLSSTVSIVDKDGANVIANYNVSVDASFEITPATIAYTMPSNLEFTYNANSHSATLSDVTDNIQVLYSVDGTNYSTSVPTFVNAGSYKVYAKMSRANYTDEETSFVIVINRADVTISANSILTTYGKAFKQSDLTYTASIAGNFDVTLSTDYYQGASVGSYEIKVDVKDDANFNVTKVNSTITVEKAPLSATISSASIVYGEDFTPTTSLVQLEGLLAGDDAMLTMSTTYTLGANVGEYAISCESANTNYDFTAENGTLNVTKRALTVTIGSQNIVYGQNYQELEHSITEGSLALDDSYTLEDMTAYVVGSNFGEYPLSANVVIANNKADNYDVKVIDGTLNVAQYAITLTLTKPENITYGDEKPEFSYTLDKDIIAGDVISVDYTTTYAVGSDAGKYSVGAIATFANGDDDKTDNYAIKYNSTSFDVAKRFITITMATPLASYYGDPLNKIDYAITSGEFASCDEVAITPSHADATNAGRYQVGANIVISGNVFGGEHANYDITIVTSVLEVLPRPVTVTLNGADVTYGETFTANATEGGMLFVESDNALIIPTTTYYQGASVGTYEVGANILIGNVDYKSNGNYTVTIVKGKVNVSAIELAISANAVPSIAYGDSAPSEYTHTIVGTPYAMDTLVVTTTCSYVQGNDKGEYPIVNNISITRDGKDVSGNYVITNNSATLVVEEREINYTLPTLTITYGDAFDYPLDDVTLDNLYESDTRDSVVSITHSYVAIQSKPGALIDIGIAIINGNYVFGENCSSGSINVMQAPLTLTIDNKEVLYGDNAPTYTYSVAGSLIGADKITAFTANCAYTNKDSIRTHFINGELTIKNGENDVTGYYLITTTPGTLTIGARPITITYSTYHKQDGNPVSFAITNDMVSNANAKDTFSGTLTTANSVNGIYSSIDTDFVGTIEINDENGWVNPINYVITYNFNVEIAASDIGCTSTSYVGTYDGKPHTGSVTPAIDGVTVTYGLSEGVYDLSDIPTFTNAGAYTVYFKATKPEMTDYFGSFTVTINKKSATLAFNKTLTYGDDYSIPSLTEISGLSQDEIEEIGLAIDCGGYSNGANAGTYNVTFSYNDANGNFDIVNNGGSIVVEQIAMVVTFDSANYTVTYGDDFVMPNYTVTGADKALVSVSNPYSAGDNVGTYEIEVINLDETNYKMTVVGKGTITVVPRDVILNDTTTLQAVYGLDSGLHPSKDFVAQFMYSGDTFEVGGFDVASTLNVGTYYYSFTMTINGEDYALNSNYNVVNKQVAVTISPAPITVKANDCTLTYGDAPLADYGYTLTNGALVNGDVLNVATNCNYAKGDDAQTYVITLAVEDMSNYTITTETGTLTVNKATIDVTFDSITVEYGDAVDVNSLFTVGSGQDKSVITLETTHTSSSQVGTYAVTFKCSNDNYNVNATLGNITVVTRVITVSVDNTTVIYGDEIGNINFSASYDDANKYVVIEPLYSVGDGVGTYAFNVSLNSSAEGRYVLDLDNSTIGNITVAKKTIVVTPEDLTKVYDGVVPTIKFTSTDLVGTDTLDVTFSGIDNVNVGTYTVRANVITHDNYVIDNSASATLTINPRPVKVTANDVSVGYNTPAPSITFTTDFKDANEFITVSVPSYTVGNNAGNYPLVANVSGSDNFTISSDSVLGNLVVEPVNVTVSVENTSVVYGEAWTAPTFTTDPASAHDYFTITTDYVVGSGVGEYAYKFVSSNPNYAVSANVGKLTVTPAPLTITLNQHDAITYGDAVPTDFSATIVGAKNGELDALNNALKFSTLYTATSNASQTGYDYYLNTVETNKAEVFANYTYTAPASLKLVVNKKDYAPGEFSHRNLEVTYAPALTLASLYLDANFEWGNANTSVGDAGVHTFDAQYLGDENHNPCTVTVKVTVLKAPVTITGTTVQEFNFASGTTHTFSTADFKAMYGDTDVTSLGSFVDVLSTGDAGTFGFNMAFTSTNYSGTIKCYMKVQSVDVGGTLYTIEDALNTATSGTIKLTTSTSFADEFNSCYNGDGYYTIKSGVTLFLPYSATDTTGWIGAGEDGSTNYSAHPGSNGTPTLYINLTVPANVNLVANGNITVGAMTGSKNSGTQQNKVSGGYSQITLNGTLTTNSITLRVMGYIKGTGSIVANNTTVIENLYLSGWVGGTISTARYGGDGQSVSGFTVLGGGTISINNPNMFPFNQYELRAIQVATTYNHGSKLQGYTKIATSEQSMVITIKAQINEAYLTFITNSTTAGDGILHTTSGAKIIKSFANDRVKFDLFGTVNDGYTALSMKVIGCTATMSSEKVIFPIDGRTDITVKSGATFNQNYKFKLLPGATLTVDSSATYNLNGTTVMYDSTFTDINTYSYPGATRGNSTMTINGTMNLNGAFGGNVTGTGKVVVGSSATVSNVKSVEGTGSGARDGINYVFSFTDQGSVTKNAQANGANMSAGQTYNLTA